MPLTGPRDMFAKALAGGFAVGAFNINNMETVQGILQAAGDERSPVILQVSNGARQYAGRGYLRKMAEAAAFRAAYGSRVRFRQLQGLHRRRVHFGHDRRLTLAF